MSQQKDEKVEEKCTIEWINSVLKKIESVQQRSTMLISQVGTCKDLSQDLQEKYKELQAKRKEVRDLNKHLERKVFHLTCKMTRQRELEVECQSAREEISSVIEENQNLEQVIEMMNSKIKDCRELEDEHKKAKCEIKAASQQNKELKQRVQERRNKLCKQIQLEDKIRTKLEKKETLDQENSELEHLVQELNEQLGDAERIQDECRQLEAKTKATQPQVRCFKKSQKKMEPSDTRHNNMVVKLDQLHSEEDTSEDEVDVLENKLGGTTFFSSRRDKIKSIAEIVSRESFSPCNTVQELRTNLQDCEGAEGTYGAAEELLKRERRNLTSRRLRQRAVKEHYMFEKPQLPNFIPDESSFEQNCNGL